ncbi:MAG: LuxR family transcriptional regulator [Nitrospira sp.]
MVDDDPLIRETVRLVLSREGYGVLMAADSHSAIDIMNTQANANTVCVLLVDLEMPKTSGKELIAHFRTHYSTIPIIVFSGAADATFLEGIVQNGVCDWIRKPAAREILLQKVGTAANLYALRQSQGE